MAWNKPLTSNFFIRMIKRYWKERQDIIICIVSTVEGMIIQIASDSSGCRIIRIIPVHGRRISRTWILILPVNVPPMIRFAALVTGRYSNISASDVISWNIVSLWQTEHIVLNCISQSLGMVRAEALPPTVKDCVYLMLPWMILLY